MPKVYHKRNAPPGATYVGRPSIWGNPFVLGRDGNRDEVIAKYAAWLNHPNQDKLKRRVSELKGKDLVCFCAPLSCHADILLKLANED